MSKMKYKYAIMYGLMILPLVITAVCLLFMPDQVPMHYNAAGEVDRIGSKYENVIFPIITIGMGLFFMIIAKSQTKKEDYNNEKVLVISGIATLLLFNALTIYFLYKDFTYTPSVTENSNGTINIQLMNIGLGVILCILGNMMPKARLNSVIGLRTVWSMKNDNVWMKSQRFGGISFVICGVLIIILSIFIKSIWGLALTLSILIIDTIISAIASYRFYKKDLE